MNDPAAEPEQLAHLERYYDTVPRATADSEDVGPFTLFVARAGWPFYARPRLGLTTSVSADDVRAVLERQLALDVPRTLEWVAEVTPSLESAVAEVGLTVHHHPLMVLVRPPVLVPPPPGTEVRILAADDHLVGAAQVVASLGFTAPGTGTGPAGPRERDSLLAGRDADTDRPVRDLLRSGLSVLAVAVDARDGVLSVGSHNPRDGVSEVVGVATLPAARRLGLGAAVTSALVEDALSDGLDTVFLSAGDKVVARVYERVGFREVGTACVAEVP